MTLFALSFATIASAAPTVTYSGTCPGNVSVTIHGLTPNGAYARMTANAEGSHTKAGGACAGTTTNLSDDGFAHYDLAFADGLGNATLPYRSNARDCNTYMQVMDLSTCSTSGTALIAAAGGDHLTEHFSADQTQGQWCDGDALVRYHYYGETDYDTCEDLANATGTQWFVGQWTDHLQGWIGDADGSLAVSTSPSDWTHEVVESRATLRSCVLGWVDHRSEPTTNPGPSYYTDKDGRDWTYWILERQTHSQVMAFADIRGARIINGVQVGLGAYASMTAPTHWCHAGAQFNGASYLNSDERGTFVVGYWD